LYETKTFLIKACNRSLVSNDEFQTPIIEIEKAGVKLNNNIKSIGRTSVNTGK